MKADIAPTKNCTSEYLPEGEYRSLISAFSHEVKNQLTLINSSLQLVARECPAVSNLSLWPQICQEVKETICLLKDASSFALSGQIELKPFSVFSFFQRISDSLSPLMKERTICFQTNIEETLTSATLCGDALKLKEAITNLLLNAADAVSANETSRRLITLSAGIKDSKLCIHVRDNGPGILPEYLETLFDPFVTHKSHGTGLGLAITKNIIEQHGGSISVSTHTVLPDTYTDFSVKIPVL